jgi:hypothetical protein
MVYSLRALRDVPELELLAGDLLMYDPADACEPYTVHRAVNPDQRGVITAFAEGALEAIDVAPAGWIRQASAPRAPARVLQFPAR